MLGQFRKAFGGYRKVGSSRSNSRPSPEPVIRTSEGQSAAWLCMNCCGQKPDYSKPRCALAPHFLLVWVIRSPRTSTGCWQLCDSSSVLEAGKGVAGDESLLIRSQPSQLVPSPWARPLGGDERVTLETEGRRPGWACTGRWYRHCRRLWPGLDSPTSLWSPGRAGLWVLVVGRWTGEPSARTYACNHHSGFPLLRIPAGCRGFSGGCNCPCPQEAQNPKA